GSDEELLLKADHWITETVAPLVGKYHHEVGNTERESLLQLGGGELVVQINEQVGAEWQCIRLNGAVVGGRAGRRIAPARPGLWAFSSQWRRCCFYRSCRYFNIIFP